MFVNMLSTGINSLLFGYILDFENGDAVNNLGLVLEVVTTMAFLLFNIAEICEQMPLEGQKKFGGNEEISCNEKDTFLVSDDY